MTIKGDGAANGGEFANTTFADMGDDGGGWGYHYYYSATGGYVHFDDISSVWLLTGQLTYGQTDAWYKGPNDGTLLGAWTVGTAGWDMGYGGNLVFTEEATGPGPDVFAEYFNDEEVSSMRFLRQSTAVTVKIGPFVDSVDASVEAGLTLTQADIRLSKNGGDLAQKNEASAAAADENGMYDCALDTTDTGTLGSLVLVVNETGALVRQHEFMVVAANVYDAWFGATLQNVNPSSRP